MQTILGAGGAIGLELAKVLPEYTKDIRLVSRNPKKVNDSDHLHPADLTKRDEIFNAVAGSEITYVLAGFPYKAKLWKELWPSFMKNTIDACLEHNSKLVFFDNVYAIGGDNVKHITESSKISPTSKKGEVRAEVDQLVLDAVKNKGLQAIIARSADFFSNVKGNSILMNMIYDNLAKGKKAQWLCNKGVIHNCSYTPDLAKGTAMLANSSDTYNQIWNLPTDPEKITGQGWTELFAKEMGVTNTKMQVLPGWGIKLVGLFVPVVGEMYEMRYQYDRDYFFDSSKFNNHFKFTPTSNAEAVKRTVELLKDK